MNGVLVVDKPLGPTSHDVVARVRRIIGERRVGHTGTLDPLATGVLPLIIGQATRLAQLLSEGEKEYLAGVRLGAETATYDAESLVVNDPSAGGVVAQRPASLTTRDVPVTTIEQALSHFRGTFRQTPPPFSAKKVAGVPAHRLARSRKPVAIDAVEVTARAVDLVGYDDGLVTLRIVASSGFYVRSLAHDLGRALGCGAYLETLRRTRAGEFDVDAAVPLITLEENEAEAAERLIPMERLLLTLPAIVLTERGARRASHGNTLATSDIDTPVTDGPVSDMRATSRIRLLDASGRLLGIGEWRSPDLLHPVIVLV